MSGHDVKVLQGFLRKAGVRRVSVDGQFGRGTQVAVRRWERTAQRHVDGVVDAGDAVQLRDEVGAPRGTAAAATTPAAGKSTTTAAPAPTRLAPGDRATIGPDGLAVAPASAPVQVQRFIAAGNQIAKKTYIYGGGHRADWKLDRGYDCSGSVSWGLHGAGLVKTPMPSGSYTSWGLAGPGRWITIYTKSSHMYAVVAGLRFDTSGARPAAPAGRPTCARPPATPSAIRRACRSPRLWRRLTRAPGRVPRRPSRSNRGGDRMPPSGHRPRPTAPVPASPLPPAARPAGSPPPARRLVPARPSPAGAGRLPTADAAGAPRLVVAGRPSPGPLARGRPALGVQAALLRRPGRPGRVAGARHRERPREAVAEARERELAVARLAAGVLRHGPDDRSAAGPDARLLRVAERRPTRRRRSSPRCATR